MNTYNASNYVSPVKGLSRRRFMQSCATCALCASAFGSGARKASAIEMSQWVEKMKPKVTPRIRLVFTHRSPTIATWPYQGYDYEGRKKELTAKLRSACPDVEFIPVTIQSRTEAEQLLKEDKDKGIDGYLVYLIGLWTQAPQVIASSGKPVLFVDDLYAGSGEFLIAYAAAKRKGDKVAGISSSRFEDVVKGVRCFECLKKLQVSVILDVTDREKLWGNPEAIQEVFGTEIRAISSNEINEVYRKADSDYTEQWARYWMRKARRIVEPTDEDIRKSAAIYLAMVDLMGRNAAQAIAVDCLGLFYAGKLPAYPCLGFFQLNNDGLVGACEGDLTSTITMLIMNYLVGRPGYISDPVIDTANNQIIYAHCVAPTQVFGPDGPSNPYHYHIRSHSEDRKGACVQSFMPLREMTTTLEVHAGRKEVIIHQGRSVANIDEDKACRNKLAVEVKGDINKLMTEWDRWGWHRVTFYGDHKKAVEMLSALIGFTVIHEA